MISTATITLEVTLTTLTVSHEVLKRCLTCNEFKPITDFNKNKYRKSGLANDCRECYRSKYLSKWEGSTYKADGLSGHWTKWGGGVMGVIQDELDPIWVCQSCGQEQPKDLTPYKYQFPENEWIRVCATCYHDGCLQLKERMKRVF